MRLNIGCGAIKLDGYINIDKNIIFNPDIVRDVEKGLPFSDNTSDEVLCSHVLEHISDLMFVVAEIYRVLKDGAFFKIVIPLNDFSDMTHVRTFDRHTFRTLTEHGYWTTPYYVGKFTEVDRHYNELSTCTEMTLLLRVLK